MENLVRSSGDLFSDQNTMSRNLRQPELNKLQRFSCPSTFTNENFLFSPFLPFSRRPPANKIKFLFLGVESSLGRQRTPPPPPPAPPHPPPQPRRAGRAPLDSSAYNHNLFDEPLVLDVAINPFHRCCPCRHRFFREDVYFSPLFNLITSD